MRRTLWISIAALALVALSAAQASAEVKLSGVGLKLHGSLASAVYDQENVNPSVDNTLGFGGGLQLLLSFSDLFGLQPELLFINKGHSVKTEFFGVPINSSISMNYAQLPLFAVLKLPIIPAVTPKLMVGPHLAYLISGSTTAETTNASGQRTSTTTDLKTEDYSSIDLGLSAAAGVDIALDSYTLTLDLRWERGLLGVSTRADEDENWVHTAMSFNVGIMF